MTTEATRFSPPSKSVPALVLSWWFWETKWLTYSLHSLQFLTNFLDSFLATLLLGLGPPPPCLGLSGQPEVHVPPTQPLGQPAHVVPVPILTHPKLLILASGYAPRRTAVCPVDLSRFQLAGSSSLRTPTPQPQNSNHDTPDAYCLSFLSTSILPVDPEGHCSPGANWHV